MATLVLTAVGVLVGGPAGAAIGAAIGQQVDQRLFAPKGRQGPRLGDLSVQVSRYGQQIPRLFGTMRVAGSVIWATDLIEDKHKSGGGKGKPKTTSYSYSASFAVALSARPIRAVHRIWADGKLLRGTAGDWKAQTHFRLYTGDEDQPLDPLIAAAEGSDRTPAYRGLAYAVFEHLELADFGNHIPSLTFEVEADAAPVTLGAIAAELSDGAVTGIAAPAFLGFAASGDSVRGAIETLGRSAGLSIRDDGSVLGFAPTGGTPLLVDVDLLGATPDGKRQPRVEQERLAVAALPDEIAVAYYEPARDFQSGLQRARRGGPGRRGEQIDLAAALEAQDAKALAERRLADLWAERVRRTVRLPWRALALRPGDRVRLPDSVGSWRITALHFEKMAIEAKLVGTADGLAVPPASPGRAITPIDLPHGATTVHLIDLPPIEDALLAAPRLWIVAAGASPGWRRAALLGTSDGGLSYEELGQTAAPATMGSALTALGPGTSLLFDSVNSLDVALLHDGMTLEGCSDDALVNGANLALAGNELIQFGQAELIGSGRYRLRRLLRGRRGSEAAMTDHAIGERFILIESASLLAYDLPLAKLGGSIGIIASGIGDAVGAEADCLVTGQALRPPAPVQLDAARRGDGTIDIRWARRGRNGWAWLDGGDIPLGEEAERYQLVLTPSIGAPRTIALASSSYAYGPAEQLADGAVSASTIQIDLVQFGTLAPSLIVARATFPI